MIYFYYHIYSKLCEYIMQCKLCNKEISGLGKSGLCSSCVKKGKSPSIECRLKISTSKKGWHQSDESKEKIRQSMLGEANAQRGKPSYRKGRIPWNKGKTGIYSKETIDKIRTKHILYMQEHPEFYSSKSETAFLNKLEELYNIKIERQYPLEGRSFDGRYQGILIECDGSYWHSSDDSWFNDIWKNILSTKNGFTLYRFPVNSTADALKQVILNKDILDKIFH